MVQLPPASTTGLAAGAGKAGKGDFLIAFLLAILLSAPLASMRLIGVLGIAALVFGAVALLARRQIGGYSGDVLGALQQSAEIAILLTLLAQP